MKNKDKIILLASKTGYWEGSGVHPNIMPPTGLLAIASNLQNHYEVIIIDQRIENWKQKLSDELKNKPKLIGLSFMTGEPITYALSLCRLVKEESPETLIFVGGVHPSLMPDETIREKDIDFVVVGEGEKTAVELADSVFKKKDITEVKGIYYKKNKKIIRNDPQELLDLNLLPPLPYELVPIDKYTYLNRYGLIIETSRGCPYRCTYCYNKKFNRGIWRKKSAKKVVEEIHHYYTCLKRKDFHFIDDNFFVDLERAKSILKGIKKIDNNIKIEFQGVRADSICKMDSELLQLFRSFRKGSVRVGIESGSQKTLDNINKNVKIEQYIKANEILAKNKIKVYYNFMIGFPSETTEDLKKTTKFAVKLMDENPYARVDFMAIYQPYPGTALFDYCINKGFFQKPRKLEDWAKLNWDAVNLSYFTEKRKNLLEKIHIASVGLIIRKNSKLDDLDILWKLMARVYRIIVRQRMKHFNFRFFFEKFFYELGKKKTSKREFYIMMKNKKTKNTKK